MFTAIVLFCAFVIILIVLSLGDIALCFGKGRLRLGTLNDYIGYFVVTPCLIFGAIGFVRFFVEHTCIFA